jgi:RimJ/RimL family protein N-acetyltransferase
MFMSSRLNAFQQLIGDALPEWSAKDKPTPRILTGQYCRLEPLDAQRHAASLYQAFALADDARDWTYMLIGPFNDEAAYRAFAQQEQAGHDPLHFAVIDLASGKPVGSLALMRIDATSGVVEVGYVNYSPLLKRTVAATEAQYLLMQLAFDTFGYRRYEWKCDSLNAPSRAAARYGFQFEGIFRQATVYKGRTRDTAWFSILDKEWPQVQAGFQAWLNPNNFDQNGRQIRSLSALRQAARL